MTTLMYREMSEQPEVLARLVRCFGDDVCAVRSVLSARTEAVVLVGRGSSDNAATLGRYAIECATGRPVALAAPSLTTRYHVPADYRNVLVVGLSQSGRTPEITSTVAALKAAGARTIAVTNDPDSPLAQASHLTLPLGAGSERAVPATKTVTAQMLRMLTVAAALGDGFLTASHLDALTDAVSSVLEDPGPATRLADRWRAAETLIVTARGLLLSAAQETALKIREIAGITAIAGSSSDLVHGPIASLRPGDPVLLIDGDPATAADAQELEQTLDQLGVDRARLGAQATDALPIPAGISPFILPIVATVRGQQLALELAFSRGCNPDAPAGLTKVTATR